MKLKRLDVVRTRFGTIAVVERVSVDGRASLVLPVDSHEKVAWYEPEELDRIASVTALVQMSKII